MWVPGTPGEGRHEVDQIVHGYTQEYAHIAKTWWSRYAYDGTTAVRYRSY